MLQNKYKNTQASKQLCYKSTLKSILFCGLIGFSLIGSNEVCGANAHQKLQELKKLKKRKNTLEEA